MSNQSKRMHSACRPSIGDAFFSAENEMLFIAATWNNGVVFEGGPAISMSDLRNGYRPAKKSTTHFLRNQ